MAIFSLHHSSIGKSTQAQPFTAAAHVRYVTRESACSRTAAARMPEKPGELMGWFRAAEQADRKNARVCDKVMLALPRELDAVQRGELVRAFADRVTAGKAAWFAAFHEAGKDADNPHCHLIIRDRHPETGKRVIGMSEAGSTERLRLAWEEACNRALAEAEQEVRVSRLTLEAQRIERQPTVHEGVRARRMARDRKPTRSQRRRQRNAAKARSRDRMVDYPSIDRGKPRRIHNAEIRARAKEREAWAAIDADALVREMDAQRRIHRPDLLGQPGRDVPESWHDDPHAAADAPLGRGGNSRRDRGSDGADRRVYERSPTEAGAGGEGAVGRGAGRVRGGRRVLSARAEPIADRAPPGRAADRSRGKVPANSRLAQETSSMAINPHEKDLMVARSRREAFEDEWRNLHRQLEEWRAYAIENIALTASESADVQKLQTKFDAIDRELITRRADERAMQHLFDKHEAARKPERQKEREKSPELGRFPTSDDVEEF